MTALDVDRIQHLQMLQGAISRMAGASAAIKNLCLIVLAGALAFIATTKNPALAVLTAVLTVVFWFLDARYLQQEKWFRAMYDAELARDDKEVATFVMTPSKEIRAATGLRYGLKSWSTRGLYIPLIVFLLVVALVVMLAAPAVSSEF
jgi:hypothetical protein